MLSTLLCGLYSAEQTWGHGLSETNPLSQLVPSPGSGESEWTGCIGWLTLVCLEVFLSFKERKQECAYHEKLLNYTCRCGRASQSVLTF